MKFKIWHETGEYFIHEMFPDDSTEYLINKNGDVYRLAYTPPAMPHQFTSVVTYEKDMKPVFNIGLKDKNGKEIYESDIVRFPNHKDNEIYVIEWLEEYAQYFAIKHINGESLGAPGEPFLMNNCMEVMGNIYENTDLSLEQE